MFKLVSRRLRAAESDESGFTLIELLVTIVIFSVIAVTASSIIVTLNSSAIRFGNSSISQNQLAQAAATLNRDLSSATKFVSATDVSFEVTAYEANKQYDITVLYYGPGTTVPSNVDRSKLSSDSAIIEQRTLIGSSSAPRITTLIPGFNPDNQSSKLFTYFDGENNTLSTAGGGVLPTSLSQIERVEFYVSAKITGRTSPVELGSSSTPRSLANSGSAGDISATPTTPAATTLHGSLPPSSTIAQLNWNMTAGTTSYTVYRTNKDKAEVLAIIPQPDITSYTNSGLTVGETYTYTVVASGPGGAAPASNSIIVTVTPPPPPSPSPSPSASPSPSPTSSPAAP